MSDSYEIYSFIICFTVFALLTITFSCLFAYLIKSQIKLIKHGVEDEILKKEYEKSLKQKGKPKTLSIIDKVFSLVITIIVISFFIFSSCVGINDKNVTGNVPTLQVVQSASMSKKHEKNKYLFTNNLNNQIQTFDLIFTHKLPAENELKLYDIVVYEVDNILLVHRIVGIEEPNEKHPNERYFLLQGDNVESPDRFPVHYDQMKGIYKDQRIPFIGSFIAFIQSPAGYLIVALVLFTFIVTPIIENKINKIKRLRLIAIGIIIDPDTAETATTVDTVDTVATELDQTDQLEQTDQIDQQVLDDNPFKNFGKSSITFKEKLEKSDATVKARYKALLYYVYKIKGIRLIEGQKYQTFKKGNLPIIRLTIKGKTLNAYLALDTKKFENTKYVYTDASNVSLYKNYPMRVKISSDRQARWTKELIDVIAKENNLFMYAISQLTKINGKNLTFSDKLENSNQAVKERYKVITEHLNSLPNAKVATFKKHQIYKTNGKPIAKIKIVGKTLNAYLPANPTEFTNTKYKFTDVSSVKLHGEYPMRFKLTSDRQVKHLKELIDKISK